MAGHGALKRLQLIKDKLELRLDDIAVSEAALVDETRELIGRQEQLAVVQAQIQQSISEMDELGREGRDHMAKVNEFAHEDQSLRHAFVTILDAGLKELKEERQRKLDEAAEAEKAETELREVHVFFEDEEAAFRITDASYTFDALIADACRFFELHPLDVELVDHKDYIWPGHLYVRKELTKFDNAYGKVILKVKEEDAEEEEAEDADNILQLLLGKEEAAEEKDDDDDEHEAELAKLAAATGHMNHGEKAKLFLKKRQHLNRSKLYRELPIFLLFMSTFLSSLFIRRQVSAGYYQVNAIRTILVEENFGDFNEKAFDDIRTFEEVFDWMESVLVESLYPEAKYNDADFLPREVGTVMTYNRIVGAIRMRTVRSKPNLGCPGITASLNKRKVMNSSQDIYDQFFVPECHGDFMPQNEATAPYGPGIDLLATHGSCDTIPAPPPPPSVFLDNYGVPPTTEELEAMAIRKLCRAFTYSPAAVTGEGNLQGVLASYSGGGYVRDIDNPVECRQRPETDASPNVDGVCERTSAGRDDLNLALQQLKSNRWLDEATRAALITVTFYNGNLGFFCTITFMFEFSRGGTVLPKTLMSVVAQEMYKTTSAKLLANTLIEFVTYGFISYYSFIQVRLAYSSIKHHSSLGPYASDVWNLLECVVLIGFYASTYLRLLLFFSLKPDAVIFEDYYTDFGSLGRLYLETFNLDSLCVIALFFKMLKYAQLSTSMSMLWSVLQYSAKDLGYFTLMLFCLLTGFSMMALQFFGTSIEGYSLIVKSVQSLLLTLLGQFEVEDMRQASPLGIFFFFVYIVVMALVLMNIFLAILGEAYTVVRAENDEASKAKVKTKKFSLIKFVTNFRKILKAKINQRQKRKLGATGGTAEVRAAAAVTSSTDGKMSAGSVDAAHIKAPNRKAATIAPNQT